MRKNFDYVPYWLLAVSECLKKGPGYNIASTLLDDGPLPRPEIKDRTQVPQSTLSEWLTTALSIGLVHTRVRTSGDYGSKAYVEYSLNNRHLTEDAENIIRHRGREPRDTHNDYADSAGAVIWIDDYDFLEALGFDGIDISYTFRK